jgi:hypothetical protein
MTNVSNSIEITTSDTHVGGKEKENVGVVVAVVIVCLLCAAPIILIFLKRRDMLHVSSFCVCKSFSGDRSTSEDVSMNPDDSEIV